MKRKLQALLVAAAVSIAGAAWAQGEMKIETARSTPPTAPYSLSYPAFMETGVGDPDIDTYLHLPKAAMGLPANSLELQFRIVPNVPAATPEEIADKFDTDSVVAEWRKTYPDFAFGRPGITTIRNGRALVYNATLTADGTKTVLVRVEVREGGYRYVLDFYVDQVSYEKARFPIGFMIANFSTSSARARCCNDPSPIP
jgi:hypothetical protein